MKLISNPPQTIQYTILCYNLLYDTIIYYKLLYFAILYYNIVPIPGHPAPRKPVGFNSVDDNRRGGLLISSRGYRQGLQGKRRQGLKALAPDSPRSTPGLMPEGRRKLSDTVPVF